MWLFVIVHLENYMYKCVNVFILEKRSFESVIVKLSYNIKKYKTYYILYTICSNLINQLDPFD